jgi:hypothetical protein
MTIKWVLGKVIVTPGFLLDLNSQLVTMRKCYIVIKIVLGNIFGMIKL